MYWKRYRDCPGVFARTMFNEVPETKSKTV
jgi:hypothetical protein